MKEPRQIADYQSLYNRLHSEHEAIAASYAEAKQALERDDYTAAAQLCDKFLEKFPQHTLFKALKFDIEQRWRRAISVRLIEVEEAVENEPDLEQRVLMLEKIVRENGEVPEFSRLLQATREKRGLVNGIVSRARELEARELHGEALVQWETLQTIYPALPGLAFEIENVRLRRQLGERMAHKNQWTTRISQALEAGDFEEGLRLLSAAVEEFPNDGEFAEITMYIRQNQELAEQAEKQIHQGRRYLDEGKMERGLEKLRSAYELGSKVKRAKAELVEGLLRAARVSQSDPPQARAYLQEILNLDPGNHAAPGRLRFLDDQAEHRQADELLSQARQLRTGNELDGAINLLKGACAEYPRNARLRQALREMHASRDELRTRDLEVVRRKRLEADSLVNAPSLHEYIASIEGIAGRYGDDEEFQNESRMLRARLHTMAGTTARPAPSSTRDRLREKITSIKQSRKMLPALFAGIAMLALAIAVALFWHRARANKPSAQALPTAPSWMDVTVRSIPAGAHILREGKELGVAAPTLTVKLPTGKINLEARLDGYKSKSQTIDNSGESHGEANFALLPVSQQLRVVGRGRLSLDGQRATALPGGTFSGELAAGSHTLYWRGKGGYHARFQVNVRDDEPATLTAPIRASQSGSALLVSIASQPARVYTNPEMPVSIDGVMKGMANKDGLETALTTGLHTIVAGKNPGALTSRVESGAERLLLIAFENAPSLGSLTVLTNVDGASLKVLRGTTTVREGTSAAGRWDIPDLAAGNYIVQATALASAPVNVQAIEITKGQNTTITVRIEQNPVLLPLRVQTLRSAPLHLRTLRALTSRFCSLIPATCLHSSVWTKHRDRSTPRTRSASTARQSNKPPPPNSRRTAPTAIRL